MLSSSSATSSAKNDQESSLKKDFDSTIKGNVYIVEGQKLVLPANNNTSSNTAAAAQGKLDIIHRYLVLQMYLGSGEQFSMEITLRDKSNVSYILYFTGYRCRIAVELCSLTVPRT